MTETRLKAVLFDMDDTLIDWREWHGSWVDTEERHLQSVYDYLARENRTLSDDFMAFQGYYNRLTREAWADARTSLKAPHIGRMLLQALTRYGFLPDDAIGLDHCLKAYGWEPIPGVHLFPDVVPLLEILQQHDIKMGIVTNASQPMTLRDNELLGYDLMRFFPESSHRISAADVGYLKPHSAIFEHALSVLGTEPDETIFIGDNPVADIAGAQSAGMRAVLRVLSPTKSLISGLIMPDAAINTLEELPTILDEWFPERW
jgi:FMN phosphatase YigB (HAD superfamily)